MRKQKKTSVIGWLFHRFLVIVGAASLTLAFFLILPVMQTISKPPTDQMSYTTVTTLEPPPPVETEEEEPPEEPEPEEKPELDEQPAQDLSLEQLDMALNAGMGGGGFGGTLAVDLSKAVGSGKGSQDVFQMSELDQKPRILYQPGPMLSPKVRQRLRRTSGKVYIIFMVDERGRVVNPIVQHSTDPLFEQPALAALKQWKFEPGKRNGEPVRFRMRVPIVFPKL